MLQLFSVAIFLNALLLFWMQPMFARMVLPLLGGAPAVWNTALVFFQAGLLAGYAYAHFINARLAVRWQGPVHMAVMLVPLAVLPIGIAQGWTPPADAHPVPWLMALMTVSVGLPFFAVATNGALLQHWFSRTGHRDAGDPYFLYSASNLGSLIALLGYPVLFAPFLGLASQSRLWTAAYVVLAGLIGWCAWKARLKAASETPAAPADSPVTGPVTGPVTWKTRGAWTVLALVPSSLLLGVTTHISSEVTVAPLLWVVPLALYLLTFVNVFARRPWISHAWAVRLQALLVIVLAITFNMRLGAIGLVFALHLGAFFLTALVCHGELARQRPPVRRLTEFYLWLAVGGALGGVFNALLAPLLFDGVVEYPLAIILACALRPVLSKTAPGDAILDVFLPAALAALLLAPFLFSGFLVADVAGWVLVIVLTSAAAASFWMRTRPLRFALSIAVLLTAGGAASGGGEVAEMRRTFFGIHKVLRDAPNNLHQLVHGMTLHGTQFAAPERWREPMDYYHAAGPLGQFFSVLGREEPEPGKSRTAALVGLGAGASVCYRRPDERWTFFEIDPMVETLARDTRYFHFLEACGGGTKVVLGDARLRLAEAGTGPFDIILLDAFGSDAVPAHLLTVEAMALYRRRLAPGGFILFHLSNRHMDLGPVVAGILKAAGMTGLIQVHHPDPAVLGARASRWVLAAARAERLIPFAADGRWRPLKAGQSRPWTDDYWNILAAIKWK